MGTFNTPLHRGFEIDTSSFPLVRIHAGKTIERVDIVNAIAKLESLYARGHYAILWRYYEDSGVAAAEAREEWVKWHRAKSVEIQKHIFSVAFVLPKPKHRGALIALQWFITLPPQYRTFSHLQPALDHLMCDLSRSGLDLSHIPECRRPSIASGA